MATNEPEEPVALDASEDREPAAAGQSAPAAAADDEEAKEAERAPLEPVLPWEQIVTDLDVPAEPKEGLWTPAYEWVAGPCCLKIEASGKWQYADDAGAKCGPDGQRVSYLSPDRCLAPKSPVGALIGKLGGSTCDGPTGEEDQPRVFSVGSFCIVTLAKSARGPLFLSINDAVAGFDDNLGSLKVQIHRSALAPSE